MREQRAVQAGRQRVAERVEGEDAGVDQLLLERREVVGVDRVGGAEQFDKLVEDRAAPELCNSDAASSPSVVSAFSITLSAAA